MKIRILKIRISVTIIILAMATLFSALPLSETLGGDQSEYLDRRLGERDAVLLCDPAGETVYAHHPDSSRIPASTFKILTAYTAFYSLGGDFRFKTEFYLDEKANVYVKGYGDPLLISEVIADMASGLARHVKSVNDVVLDNSFFRGPIQIPGVSDTFQPYDSPSGALCVNFNTVCFKRINGGIASAEPQTPLVPWAVERIKQSRLKSGRIVFSEAGDENLLYAGHLMCYFFKEAGIQVEGEIRTGRAEAQRHRLVMTYHSPFTLDEVVRRLMEFSNNFIANQLMLAAGAARFGEPADLEKGVSTLRYVAEKELGLTDVNIVEGSGISRENRISPRSMVKLLDGFTCHGRLLKKEGDVLYKTGTLTGISTRAGYIETPRGLYRFAVLLNTPGKTAERIQDRLVRMVP